MRVLAIFALSFLASTLTALAQTQQQLDWCTQASATLDQTIDGCSAIIRSGKYGGANLALAYHNRAIAWYGKNEYEHAIVDFNQAIKLNPKEANGYISRGAVWLGQRDYEHAIADYDEAIRLNPQLPKVFFARGNVRAAKREYDLAIADYTEAIRLDPVNGGGSTKGAGYYNRAIARRNARDYERAISDFDKALELNPQDADARNNRDTTASLLTSSTMSPSKGIVATVLGYFFPSRDNLAASRDAKTELERLTYAGWHVKCLDSWESINNNASAPQPGNDPSWCLITQDATANDGVVANLSKIRNDLSGVLLADKLDESRPIKLAMDDGEEIGTAALSCNGGYFGGNQRGCRFEYTPTGQQWRWIELSKAIEVTVELKTGGKQTFAFPLQGFMALDLKLDRDTADYAAKHKAQ